MPDLEALLLDIESIVHHHDTSRIDDLIAWLDAGKESRGIDDWLGERDAMTDTRLAWAAAWALGHLGDARAVPALDAAFRRHEYHCSPGAAVALLRLGPDEMRRRTMATLVMKWKSLTVGLGGYCQLRPYLAPLVSPFCRSLDPVVRKMAREFIATLNEGSYTRLDLVVAEPDEIEAWLEQLDDPRDHVVNDAAMNLARCEPPPMYAAARLREALERARAGLQHDPRSPLAHALARTGDPDAMDPLLELLVPLDIRITAAHGLDLLLTTSASRVATGSLSRLLDRPDEILCVYDWNDLNWNNHKEITDVDLRPLKAKAASELARRGLTTHAET